MSIAQEIQRLQSAKADIKSAIEEKGVTVGDGTIDTYAEKIAEISGGGSGDYEQGFEDGKNSVVDYCKLANAITFKSFNVFEQSVVELTLDNLDTLANFIEANYAEQKNITVEHFTLNSKGTIKNASYAFSNVSASRNEYLKTLTLNVDLSNATTVRALFNYCVGLETINGIPLNFNSAVGTSATTNIFAYCNALKDVRFAEKSIQQSLSINASPNLSDLSIQSIIDGLADLTGGTAQTLTVHKSVGNKLTDTQKATITAKNWELVY